MYLAWRRISHWLLALPAIAAIACTDPTSATALHPEGPPMVQQVRLSERYTVDGASQERVVFAFGTHPDATPSDEHPVTTAQPVDNKLRIIMDELLRGNDLEEIACRAEITPGNSFSRVPVGATPDDIARCAVPRDALSSRCPGSNPLSVCLCAKEGGCQSMTDSFVTPEGAAVGVFDNDRDGAADQTRLIAGAVGIQCGTIAVPIDRTMSYWTPSGNQQKPALGGFDALGPAVVLVPQGALPTSMDCGVVFSPEVVDKDGNQVCAPPDGDITRDCTPGDTTAVHFKVAEMTFSSSVTNAAAWKRTDDVAIDANVVLDPASITNATVTVTEGPGPGTAYTQFQPMPGPAANRITIHWTAADGLAAATRYTITVLTTVTDAYHQPAPQPVQFSFTTAAN